MRRAHLVGSIPLRDSREVMQTVGRELGPFLDRIPDGETGERLGWLNWQRGRITAEPGLVPSDALDHYGRKSHLLLAPGVSGSDVSFGAFGYADAALESFAEFSRQQEVGLIPGGVRFQVNLPTPLAILAAYIDPRSQEALEPQVEAALMTDLRAILAGIDPARLALQWDVAIEFAILHVGLAVWFPEKRAGIIDRLARLARQVPHPAQLGYHLCFGDSGHKHFVEPESLAPLVSIANAVSQAAARPIDWFHMPVPRDRSDDAYFAPLREYRCEADLYLGLIHLTDGFDGTARRMAAAQRFGGAFGVATECGFGRRPPETVAPLLELHRQVCERL